MKNTVIFIFTLIFCAALGYAGEWGQTGSNPVRGNYHPDGTTITAASDGTMSAASGALGITDSTSTTSSTTAASATAVKAAKDAADAKVSSVSGSLPIRATSGTTPAISLASVPYGNLSTAMRSAAAWQSGGVFYNISTVLHHRIR